MYKFTKKQRLIFLVASILVSLISLVWYMTQSSAVSMLLLVMAISGVISQIILIKTRKYKTGPEEDTN